MLYKVEIEIQWDEGSYRTTRGIRAVSRRHALDKGIMVAWSLPCYADRREHGLEVRCEAKLREDLLFPANRI